MIIDSSAIVAGVRGEAEARAFTQLIEASGDVRISAATYLESSVVLGPVSHERFDTWLSESRASVVAFDTTQARIARRAYTTFGKGSGSPARLNFGDCFSYALATVLDQPLLFQGDDFVHTDVRPAYVP